MALQNLAQLPFQLMANHSPFTLHCNSEFQFLKRADLLLQVFAFGFFPIKKKWDKIYKTQIWPFLNA